MTHVDCDQERLEDGLLDYSGPGRLGSTLTGAEHGENGRRVGTFGLGKRMGVERDQDHVWFKAAEGLRPGPLIPGDTFHKRPSYKYNKITRRSAAKRIPACRCDKVEIR
jgi:hypothetical protein